MRAAHLPRDRDALDVVAAQVQAELPRRRRARDLGAVRGQLPDEARAAAAARAGVGGGGRGGRRGRLGELRSQLGGGLRDLRLDLAGLVCCLFMGVLLSMFIGWRGGRCC